MKGRELPQRNMGRYWLTMSDAAVFTSIQSIFSIAEALRRDLADKAGILSAHHPADIGLVLVTAAESGWGKGKTSQLVSQIVDLQGVAPAAAAKVHSLIAAAITKLPMTLWSSDKYPARRELLDELQKHVSRAHIDIPRQQSKIAEREQEWRAAIAAMRKAQSDQAFK